MTTVRGDVAGQLAQLADVIDALATIAERPGYQDSLERIAKRVRAVYKPMVPCALVALPEPDGTAKPDSAYVHDPPATPYWRLAPAPTGDRLFVADASHTLWTSGEEAAREWLVHDALAMLAAALWPANQGGGR